MNAKIITVWGANGSGKTTVAVNLAVALAERDLMVGIISSKLIYGELQSVFGKRVENEKGIYTTSVFPGREKVLAGKVLPADSY